MKNTHVTKKYRTHSARQQTSFGLLAIFFMLLLWGSHASVKAAMAQQVNDKQQPVINNNEQNEDKKPNVVAVVGNNVNQHDAVARKSSVQQAISSVHKTISSVHKTLTSHKKTIQITAVVVGGLVVIVKLYSYLSSNSNASASSGPKVQQYKMVPVKTMKPVKREVPDSLEAAEASWRIGSFDDWGSLKGFFNKLKTTTVTQMEEVTTWKKVAIAAPEIGWKEWFYGALKSVGGALKSAGSWFAYLPARLAVWAKNNPGWAVFALFISAAGTLLIWWKFFYKYFPPKDATSAANGALTANQCAKWFGKVDGVNPVTYHLGGAVAGYLGQKMFKWTSGYSSVKGWASSLFGWVLPNQDTVNWLADKLGFGPNRFTSWGGGNNPGSSNSGAAGILGGLFAEQVGSLLGGLVYYWLLRLYRWMYPVAGKETREALAEINKKLDENRKAQEAAQSKHVSADKDERKMWVRMLESLGLTKWFYSVLDKVSERLRDKIENDTKHQLYTPRSMREDLKNTVMDAFKDLKRFLGK